MFCRGRPVCRPVAGCAWGVASASQISERNLGRRSWASAPTPRGGRGTARRVVVPHGWLRRAAAIALGSGAQRGVCGAGAKKWAGIAAEIIPKVSSNAGQSLSRPAGDSSLCTREPLGTGIRAAEVVGPYGKPNQPPKPAARSEASAPAWARDGRESTQEPSQKGAASATAGAALSEAESAERAAGQIRFLPDD